MPLYDLFQSPELTVTGPAGRFQVALGGSAPPGVSGLTPTGVGPGALDSPLCLVRFDGATRPTVLFGAGGPRETLVSTEAWDVAVSIGSSGLSAPVTSLPATSGQAGPDGEAGLGTERITFEGGKPLLVGLNGAFGYVGAYTNQPPVVLDFVGGSFVNVTPSYPDLVASSAPALWTTWQQLRGSKAPANDYALDTLAGWVAVECAIGQKAQSDSQLSSLQAAGWVTASFVQATEQQAVQTGYCTAT